MTDPGMLRVGWTVLLPADAAASPPAGAGAAGVGEVVVEPGDTLSGIAAAHDVADWHRLWAANAGSAQPGGKQLTDPDHIGWVISNVAAADETAARAPRVQRQTRAGRQAEAPTVATPPAPPCELLRPRHRPIPLPSPRCIAVAVAVVARHRVGRWSHRRRCPPGSPAVPPRRRRLKPCRAPNRPWTRWTVSPHSSRPGSGRVSSGAWRCCRWSRPAASNAATAPQVEPRHRRRSVPSPPNVRFVRPAPATSPGSMRHCGGCAVNSPATPAVDCPT